jgi:hypothetical protein
MLCLRVTFTLDVDFFFSLTLLFTMMQMGFFACRRVTSYIYHNFPFPFLLCSQKFDVFSMWIRPLFYEDVLLS